MYKFLEIARTIVQPQLSRQCYSTRTQTGKSRGNGSCGIPPWGDPVKKQHKDMINSMAARVRFKLPDHLVRPTCVPGSQPGEEQTCLLEHKGMFCPVDRLKYKYPPFSENMSMIPGDGRICWWFNTPPCGINKEDQMFVEKPDIQEH